KTMASKRLRAVILGLPGWGKGTVCQRIAQNFGLQHLSSGHFLGENIKANTEVGETAQQYIEKSLLVPDHVITRLMIGRVYNLDFNPPHVHGIDDVTGEPLVQQEDDKPEAVAARLRQYKDVAKPVIDLYKSRGVLHQFSGTETNKIWPYIYTLFSNKITPIQSKRSILTLPNGRTRKMWSFIQLCV
uniref:Nucleoside-diphosphate kinase n=1 Tax=Piliocolobus tephrosceles TaxID=591936 RepID=A0A8C9LJ30_9PRIM